ncbi:unnamed protein product [Gongylonema pulchrum]|uniref:Protein SYS1 homolog n=1 Tax=Gongylonema pulchrum TaxID=637853 RepID=A0A183EBC8_9BILA|nr:unnamed protein product [Gongylonema pulchrum]
MNAFRSYVWDPGLIIAQIVCMQAIFYTAFCVVTAIASVRGLHPSLQQIFASQVTLQGATVQLLSAAFCAFALSRVVGRSKQCLDFSCTVHFWHAIFVTLYRESFITQIYWWLLQLSSIAVCTVLGEYLCLRIESREIPVSAGGSRYEV